MHFILDNLAIGEFEEAINPSAEISALLCVAEERNLTSPCLPYHKVSLRDMQTVPSEDLRKAVEYISSMHAQGHRVLVFCNQGTGRAPSVPIAYLCCCMNYSFGQAVEAVAARMRQISVLPNLIVSIDEIRRAKAS